MHSRLSRTGPRPTSVAVVFGPLRGNGRRSAWGGRARRRRRNARWGGAARADGHAQGKAGCCLSNQIPQVNLWVGFRRARSGAISSTRPCMAMPLFGPIVSTTIAARVSAARLRSFTPSTSKSSEPSSFIVYITGTKCGQPVGPTVANRAILCDRKNSSSASLNTTHILDSTIYMARTAADNVDTIGSYTITRREPLERLEGAYLELEHQTTGARHLPLECPDDNNGFAVFFPTPPSDSTGVAHILEHVVLAGSQRFPVRDPFFSMTRRSLSTFMNALTGLDWTMYLFSTRNAKDFTNLLEVYLDAAFFPLLSEDAFQQEGISDDFENPADPNSGLRYKGVVFNEMKGALATPNAAIDRAIGKTLFPGLPYAHVSGGDPQDIPNLTWQMLRDFHARYYHPSNARFYTYGDQNLERTLEAIEKKALERFQRIAIDSSVPNVKRLTKPTEAVEPYPATPGEDNTKKAQALTAWVTIPTADSFRLLAMNILSEVLLGNVGSPLRKALIDSGLGSARADGSGLRDDYKESVFGAGLKGIKDEDAEKVQKVVLDTLQRLADTGVDSSQVDAAIHHLEFEKRERSNAGL